MTTVSLINGDDTGLGKIDNAGGRARGRSRAARTPAPAEQDAVEQTDPHGLSFHIDGDTLQGDEELHGPANSGGEKREAPEPAYLRATRFVAAATPTFCLSWSAPGTAAFGPAMGSFTPMCAPIRAACRANSTAPALQSDYVSARSTGRRSAQHDWRSARPGIRREGTSGITSS